MGAVRYSSGMLARLVRKVTTAMQIATPTKNADLHAGSAQEATIQSWTIQGVADRNVALHVPNLPAEGLITSSIERQSLVFKVVTHLCKIGRLHKQESSLAKMRSACWLKHCVRLR